MPKPSLRTRKRKRRVLRLPGSRTKTSYKKEKAGALRCVRCDSTLAGVVRATPSKLLKLAASRRRLERMYGGQLCHRCVGELLKRAVRSDSR